MIRFLYIFSLVLFTSSSASVYTGKHIEKKTVVKPSKKVSPIQQLYASMHLEPILKLEAFEQAMRGRSMLSTTNRDTMTIIDFTLPSTEKRLYVLDLKNRKVLYHSLVSHGRNSGEKFATSFSNRNNSYQSSLGFYVTEKTYQGGNGYSLVLNGLEEGINDHAKERAVVMHGADYCSEAVIASTGRLGRSYGCPALPRELNAEIINTIKEGTLLYIYADNQNYANKSNILNSESSLLAQRDVENNDKHHLN
ncbi:Uncharacterised protein [Sphingobacterium spiritivorum]|uniref:L,D-transpeptidase catalytic domain n=1 Tax=Sphingobacterium spiritivorum TaxID=258 RepID=A0A380BM72_SPHSI|nr:murein L,D-transpeptidase catalytic domain family protein [Sphingobacterium spiritivorum]SUJ02658.1 Uncharacterised protein [Sphingobacterium spiritivorum]